MTTNAQAYELFGQKKHAATKVMSSNGTEFYSYAMCIARWNLKLDVVEILDFPNGSSTTQKHVSQLTYSLSRKDIAYVYIPAIQTSGTYRYMQDLSETANYYRFPEDGESWDASDISCTQEELKSWVRGFRNPHKLPPVMLTFYHEENKLKLHYQYFENLLGIDYKKLVPVRCSRCMGSKENPRGGTCWTCDGTGKMQGIPYNIKTRNFHSEFLENQIHYHQSQIADIRRNFELDEVQDIDPTFEHLRQHFPVDFAWLHFHETEEYRLIKLAQS